MARAKQTEIPGTERPRFKDIDEAAEAFFELGAQRKKLQASEKSAGEALCEAMRKHKVFAYRDEASSLVVTLTQGNDKVKVAQVHPPGEDDGGEGDEAVN